VKQVGIVSNDAGGAEILSHWLAKTNGQLYRYHLTGPAINIFRKNLGSIVISSLDELINNCDSLICSTSWQSKIELTAIKKFKDCGRHTIAFLDHWVNYKERFTFKQTLILPDEIWVADDYAKNLASICFPNIMIRKKHNAYFEKMRKELLENKSESIEKYILYVCEPLKEHALMDKGDERFWGYTEDDALEYFFDNITSICNGINKVVIRPHPSESTDKYRWALDETNLQIVLGGQKSLIDEIKKSALVVGCESMAMVVGLLANKIVLSTIPPGGRTCQLPHKEILVLSELVKRGKILEV